MGLSSTNRIACGSFVFGAVILSMCSGCASTDQPKPAAVANNIELRNSPVWSPFSPYLEKMISTIHQEWYRLLEASRVSPVAAGMVTVHFTLNARGETNIVKVEAQDVGKQ